MKATFFQAILVVTLAFQSLVAAGSPAVTGIAAGSFHSLFIKSDGSLWVMGANDDGQLGLGFIDGTNVPQLLVSNGVGAVAAGGGQSLFRMGNALWGMGADLDGELGQGGNDLQHFPVKIFSSPSISVTEISCGESSSFFGTSGFVAGSTGLRAMGNNGAGQLGDGTTSNRYSPVKIVSTAVSAVSGGDEHTLFVLSDGSLWSMGLNSNGQLGTNSLSSFDNPIEIRTNGVVTVVAGGSHSLFLRSDNTLWGMGSDQYGQLGDNSTFDKFAPEELAINVTAMAAGENHSLYIKSDGSLWAMGRNAFGQLGDGTTNDHHIAVQIMPGGVVAVAAGENHSLFIKSDGSLWGMGLNNAGQLGDAFNAIHLTPFQIVAGPPPVPLILGTSISGRNLLVDGSNGVSGEILYTLMSTNLGLPLSQWRSVATNTLNAAGNFSMTATNAVAPNDAQQFYILQAP